MATTRRLWALIGGLLAALAAAASGAALPQEASPATAAVQAAGYSTTEPGEPRPTEDTTGRPAAPPTVVPQPIVVVDETTTEAVKANVIADTVLVASPLCEPLLLAGPPATFRRQYPSSWTVCRCLDRTVAECQPETSYATVAPGSASAVLSLEHSSSSAAVLQAEAAANAFALRHTCVLSQLGGDACQFSWWLGERPTCDCAREVEWPEAGAVTQRGDLQEAAHETTTGGSAAAVAEETTTVGAVAAVAEGTTTAEAVVPETATVGAAVQ